MKELKKYSFEKFANNFHDGIMDEEVYHFYLFFCQGLLGLNSIEEVKEVMNNDN